ncbi:hypothetical protein A6R68_11713, partial [Neotoma lepida]
LRLHPSATHSSSCLDSWPVLPLQQPSTGPQAAEPAPSKPAKHSSSLEKLKTTPLAYLSGIPETRHSINMVIDYEEIGSLLRYVDIAIPCTKGAYSLGLMWWMLARKVFQIDPEEIEKEKQPVTEEEFQGEWTAPAPEFTAA